MAAQLLPTLLSLTGEFDAHAFGAKGDGTTDDTLAIQAAINAASPNGTVYLRPGTYKLSSQGTAPTGYTYCLRVSGDFVTIQGSGTRTILANSDANAATLTFDNGAFSGSTTYGTFNQMHRGAAYDLTFGPSVPRAQSAIELNVPYSWEFQSERLRFGGSTSAFAGGFGYDPANNANVLGTCLNVGTSDNFSGSHRFRDLSFGNYYRAIYHNNAIDCHYERCLGDCGQNYGQAIYLTGASEACMFINNDFGCSGGSTAPVLIVASNGAGTPRTNRWTNCYFDTCTTGVQINAGELLHFTDCWITGNALGTAFSVPSNSTANSLFIRGCELVYALHEGLALLAGTGHIVTGNIVTSVGKDTSSAAIRIGAACSGAVLTGNTTSNTLSSSRLGAGAATHGLLVESGATGILATSNVFGAAGGISNLAGSGLTQANNL